MNYQPPQDPFITQLDREIEEIKPVSTSTERVEFFKFEKDKTKTYYFRPLPSKVPGKFFPIEKVLIHYNFANPNTGKNGAFPCLSMWGISCPLCDHVHRMENSPDFEIKVKAEQFRASEGYIMYVKDMHINKIGALQFYGKLAYQAFSNKIREIVVEGNKDFTNPLKGVIFQINKSGSGASTSYSIAVVDRTHSLTNEEMKYFEQLEPINERYGKYTQEEYMCVLKGVKFGQDKGTNSNNKSPSQYGSNNYKVPELEPLPPQFNTPVQQPLQQQYASNNYSPPQQQRQVPPWEVPVTNNTSPPQPSFPNPQMVKAENNIPSAEDLERMLSGGGI